MRKIVFITCLLCSLSIHAQKGSAGVPVVKESMKAQEKAWNAGDIKGFMDYYWKSDSLKFIGSKGITYGWQKTLDNYLKGYPTKEAMGS